MLVIMYCKIPDLKISQDDRLVSSVQLSYLIGQRGKLQVKV